MFMTQCFSLCLSMFFGFGKSITFTSRSYYYHRNSLTRNLHTGSIFLKDGAQAIHCMNLFLKINRILPLIKHNTAPVHTEMHLRMASGGSHIENTPTIFHSYVIPGENFDGVLVKACNKIKHVLI